MSRSALFVLALLVAPQWAAVAQTPAPDSFLVRRTVHIDDEVTGLRYDREYVIFRDGVLVGSVRTPERTQLVRARGSLQSVQRLQRTLSRNRFGAEAGRCNYRDQPGQGPIYRTAVSWFGRTGAQHVTIPFGIGFSQLCSERFISSIRAIEDFFFEAVAGPDAHFEDFPPS